ncbi:MAG: serine hydrolase domain-containing protein, partial [Pseudomonadales bacterium]
SVDDLVPLAESLEAHIPNQIWAPGSYSAYSNWAVAVAGLVVANVSGMSFEDYVAERIFRPLGMTRSTFDEPLPESLAADMAQGYMAKTGGIEPMGFEFIKNFGPAGALSAPAEDMAKFIIAHVRDGAYGDTRILEADTARLMHSRLFAHDPRVTGMAHGFYEIVRNGERFVGHGGDTIAFHSQLVIQPQSDFGFFLSFNTPDGARARTAVVDAVIDFFYPGAGEPVVPAPELAGSAERIARVVGAYRLNRRSYTKLEGVTGLAGDLAITSDAEGEIIVPAPAGIGGRFVEIEPYVFKKRGRQELLVFETTGDGEVDRLFVGSLPIMVADKLSAWEAAGNHQIVLLLAALAAFFVLLNSIRNRRSAALSGSMRLAKASLNLASVCYLLFAAGLALVFGTTDMNRMIFDFPPAGTGAVLVLPLLVVFFTALCVVMMVPVWRSPDCTVWQRIRYSYVVAVFCLLALVLWYWNLIGWRY